MTLTSTSPLTTGAPDDLPSRIRKYDDTQARDERGRWVAMGGPDGDVPVLGEGGKPLRLYRGTRRAGDTKGRVGLQSWTTDPDLASIYAAQPGEVPEYVSGSNVFSAHLAMQKPLELKGLKMTFGEMLRTLKYGEKGGISTEDAGKMLNYMCNRERKGPEFEYKVVDDGEFSIRMTPLQRFAEEWKDSSPEVRKVMADELQADTFIFVDSPAFLRAATALGYDGVIHDDVFSHATAPSVLLNKRYENIMGYNARRDEVRHKTYRPFKPEQVVSVWKWVPERQSYAAVMKFDEQQPRDEKGRWVDVPAEPGSTPVKEGYVRLYHQTGRQNVEAIKREGILFSKAKGVEGPRAIYADTTPFYGNQPGLATIEFQVPEKEFEGTWLKALRSDGSIRDKVDPSEFIAVHEAWHGHARYAERTEQVKEAILRGEFDDIEATDPEYGPAIKYIKAKYGGKRLPVKKYSKDQPRDDHGRWADEDGQTMMHGTRKTFTEFDDTHMKHGMWGVGHYTTSDLHYASQFGGADFNDDRSAQVYEVRIPPKKLLIDFTKPWPEGQSKHVQDAVARMLKDPANAEFKAAYNDMMAEAAEAAENRAKLAAYKAKLKENPFYRDPKITRDMLDRWAYSNFKPTGETLYSLFLEDDTFMGEDKVSLKEGKRAIEAFTKVGILGHFYNDGRGCSVIYRGQDIRYVRAIKTATDKDGRTTIKKDEWMVMYTTTPPSEEHKKQMEEHVQKFDEDQPRDEHGRWVADGAPQAAAAMARIEERLANARTVAQAEWKVLLEKHAQSPLHEFVTGAKRTVGHYPKAAMDAWAESHKGGWGFVTEPGELSRDQERVIRAQVLQEMFPGALANVMLAWGREWSDSSTNPGAMEMRMAVAAAVAKDEHELEHLVTREVNSRAREWGNSVTKDRPFYASTWQKTYNNYLDMARDMRAGRADNVGLATIKAMAALSQQSYPEMVTLYRGIGIEQTEALAKAMKGRKGAPAKVKLGLLSSWTEDPKVAANFNNNGAVLRITVPRSAIVASHRALGANHEEKEVVIASRGSVSMAPKDVWFRGREFSTSPVIGSGTRLHDAPWDDKPGWYTNQPAFRQTLSDSEGTFYVNDAGEKVYEHKRVPTSYRSILKYDENQARDAHGRFTDGAGPSDDEVDAYALDFDWQPVAGGPTTVYHGTSEKYVKTILKEGLTVKGAQKNRHYGAQLYEGDRGESIFVALKQKDAVQWARNITAFGRQGNARPVILELRLPEEQAKKLEWDEYSGGRMFAGNIPPAWITHAWVMGNKGLSEITRKAAGATFYMVVLLPNVQKYDENQPRDEQGRFADSEGNRPDGSDIRTRTTEQWVERMDTHFKQTKDEWRDLNAAEKERVANPVQTVPAQVHQYVGGKPWPSSTGNIERDIESRITQFETDLGTENVKLASSMMKSLRENLSGTRLPPDVAERVQRDALDHLLAQELEGQSRAVGDHGFHHLEGNARVSKEILAALPGGVNTAENRAMLDLAAVYHDVGYLTPPGRVLLQAGHARWGGTYFREVIAPQLEPHLGKDWVHTCESAIGGHDSTNINWADPVRSAFSIADNLALFHKEKLPPVLRMVPANRATVVALAKGEITEQVARNRMRENVRYQNGLSDAVKTRLMEAAAGVDLWFPKSILGMVGARLHDFKWEGTHLAVNVVRSKDNAAMGRVMDLGQAQFSKLAKVYHVDPDLFLREKEMRFQRDGRTLMVVRYRNRKEDGYLTLLEG